VADVTMELNGKRKRVPAALVDQFKAQGAVVVDAAPPMAPAAVAPVVPSPSGSSPTRTINDAARGFATGFSRWGSVGLDDTMAGLMTGALEVASPTTASEEGADALTRLQQGYTVGRDARRRKVERDYDASPIAYDAGAVTGIISTLPLAPKNVQAQRALAATGSIALADVDPLSLAGAGQGALGIVGGEVTKKALAKAAPIVGPVIARQLAKVGNVKDAGQAAARKGADALRWLLTKADASPVARDVVAAIPGSPTGILTAGARAGEKALRAAGGTPAAPAVAAVEEATTAPVAQLTKAELAKILEEFKAVAPPRALAAAPPAAPVATVAPAPVAVAPVAPVAPMAPPAPRPAPAVPAPSAPTPRAPSTETMLPGGISVPAMSPLEQEIQRIAIEKGTTDLATISQALRLPTTRVEDALRGLLRQFRFRDAVAKSPAAAKQTAAALDELATEGAAAATKAPPAAVPPPPMRQPGDLMPPEAMEAIRRAKTDTPNALGFLDRPGNQVAAANQGAQMRAAFAALTPEQRGQWIAQLKAQGMAPEVIKRRLGIKDSAWASQSFGRAGPPAPPRAAKARQPR